MENREVRHYQVNGKYRIVIERAASTKGTLGYKVEANGDELSSLYTDIESLKTKAEQVVGPPSIEVKEVKVI